MSSRAGIAAAVGAVSAAAVVGFASSALAVPIVHLGSATSAAATKITMARTSTPAVVGYIKKADLGKLVGELVGPETPPVPN